MLLLGSHSLLWSAYRASFVGNKAAGAWGLQPFRCNAGFQMSAVKSVVHGMHRDNFTFTLLLLSYVIIYLATLSQLYCVLAYTSTSSFLPWVWRRTRIISFWEPPVDGLPFCCKWYSNTDTDASGWQRERSAKRDTGNTLVVWNSLNAGCPCFEYLETREGKCHCIRLNER